MYGRGVGHAEPPVDGQAAVRRRNRQPARQHDLEDVAGQDVLPSPGRPTSGRRPRRRSRSARPPPPHPRRSRSARARGTSPRRPAPPAPAARRRPPRTRPAAHVRSAPSAAASGRTRPPGRPRGTASAGTRGRRPGADGRRAARPPRTRGTRPARRSAAAAPSDAARRARRPAPAATAAPAPPARSTAAAAPARPTRRERRRGRRSRPRPGRRRRTSTGPTVRTARQIPAARPGRRPPAPGTPRPASTRRPAAPPRPAPARGRAPAPRTPRRWAGSSVPSPQASSVVERTGAVRLLGSVGPGQQMAPGLPNPGPRGDWSGFRRVAAPGSKSPMTSARCRACHASCGGLWPRPAESSIRTTGRDGHRRPGRVSGPWRTSSRTRASRGPIRRRPRTGCSRAPTLLPLPDAAPGVRPGRLRRGPGRGRPAGELPGRVDQRDVRPAGPGRTSTSSARP